MCKNAHWKKVNHIKQQATGTFIYQLTIQSQAVLDNKKQQQLKTKKVQVLFVYSV